MLTTVSATPKGKVIAQTSPDSRLLSPAVATVASLMRKSSREAAPNNPDLFTGLIQPPSTTPLNMNSVFKSILQQMAGSNNSTSTTSSSNNNNINNFNTPISPTNSSCSSNNINNSSLLSTFNQAPSTLPTVLSNMALANPLVLSATAVTSPEPFQVSPGIQMAEAGNRQSSPGQTTSVSPSIAPMECPVMPSGLLGSSPIAGNHSQVGLKLEMPLAAASTAGSRAQTTATTTNTGNSTSSNTLASIANITSMLSPALSSVGTAQLLAACTPLVQLVVRQAITDCLSTCGQVTIQGQLEVTVDGMSNSSQLQTNSKATAILKFDDKATSGGQPSPPADQLAYPVSEQLSSNQGQIGTADQTTELNDLDDNNNVTLLDQEGRRFSTASQCSASSSSRRKPLNPSKCRYTNANNGPDSISSSNLLSGLPMPGIPSSESLSPPSSLTLPMIPNGCSISPSQLIHHSSPTSPSTDSGVLDLSRGTSFIESAPITPMKGLSLSTESNAPLSLTSGVNKKNVMLEAYQTLTNLQATMLSRTNNMHDFSMHSHSTAQINENNPNQLALNFYQLAQQIQQSQQHSTSSLPLHQQLASSLLSTSPPSLPTGQSDNRVTSAPNSPVVKGVRRQRLPISGSRCPTNRGSIMRRSTSSRRFPCNQCRDEFPSLHTLEEHTVTKHGSYRCHVCQAQFTQRSNLQRHALKHVGFKPFECRVCSKAYYRKDHLMRHMEMGHPGFAPRDNITVHLTSSESLEFLNRTHTNGSFLPTSSAGSGNAGDLEMDCSTFDLNNGTIEDEFDDETFVSPMEPQPASSTSPHNDITNILEIASNDVLKEDSNSCAGSLYQTNSEGPCASNDGDQSMSNPEDVDLGRSPV